MYREWVPVESATVKKICKDKITVREIGEIVHLREIAFKKHLETKHSKQGLLDKIAILF